MKSEFCFFFFFCVFFFFFFFFYGPTVRLRASIIFCLQPSPFFAANLHFRGWNKLTATLQTASFHIGCLSELLLPKYPPIMFLAIPLQVLRSKTFIRLCITIIHFVNLHDVCLSNIPHPLACIGPSIFLSIFLSKGSIILTAFRKKFMFQCHTEQ